VRDFAVTQKAEKAAAAAAAVLQKQQLLQQQQQQQLLKSKSKQTKISSTTSSTGYYVHDSSIPATALQTQTHIQIKPPFIHPLFLPWRPVRGLCNMGATCFMSSILQILLHSIKFKKSIQKFLPFNASGVLDGRGSVCIACNDIDESASALGMDLTEDDDDDNASDDKEKCCGGGDRKSIQTHSSLKNDSGSDNDNDNDYDYDSHHLPLPLPTGTYGCIACETRNLLVAGVAGPQVPYSYSSPHSGTASNTVTVKCIVSSTSTLKEAVNSKASFPYLLKIELLVTLALQISMTKVIEGISIYLFNNL